MRVGFKGQDTINLNFYSLTLLARDENNINGKCYMACKILKNEAKLKHSCTSGSF